MVLAHAWKCGAMLKHAKPSPRVHVSPFACVRCNLKLRFWTYIRGKLPVPVKPGRILPHLVNQHGFTSSYDLNKHKTRESYAGLPLSEERLAG